MGTVLYQCADLIFATKIRSTADSLGVTAKPIDGPEVPRESDVDPPAVLFVDLEVGEPALVLIERARAHWPTTRIVAFGAHVAKQTLDAARDRGATRVLPRSTFTQQLPELLSTG